MESDSRVARKAQLTWPGVSLLIVGMFSGDVYEGCFCFRFLP